MSSKDPNFTSLAKYVYRRLKNDENVSPKVVFADFSVLYGTVCSTTPKTVSKLIASFKNGDKSSLEKGPFFPLIKTKDFQLPEETKDSFEDSVKTLQVKFGAANYSKKMVAYWWNRFESGDHSCKDKQGGGREKDVPDEDFVSAVAEVPSPTPKEIAAKLGVSYKTVLNRLGALGYTLKFNRWIPYQMNDAQKTKRVQMSKELLERFRNEPEFLNLVFMNI
ncbi:hypothetical protein TYRP_016633 [Tyrophagus putrescentiae]|nr:hypothetical protein TYRP_016633 [Tyrophagus putrescentiae]